MVDKQFIHLNRYIYVMYMVEFEKGDPQIIPYKPFMVINYSFVRT